MLTTLLLYVLSAVGIWWVSQRENADRTAVLQAVVDSLTQQYVTARDTVVRTQQRVKAAGQRERQVAQALRAQLAAAEDSLAEVTHLLADSSATAAELRRAAGTAVHTADSVMSLSLSYLAEVDSIKAAHAAERRAMQAALDRADSTLTQAAALSRSLRAAECRVLGRPCPTRTQVALAGLLAGLLLTR